jgi:hypothetical protein
MPHVRQIVARYPGAEVEEIRYDGPLWSPPAGEMAEIMRGNARLLGIDPKPIISLGGSDLKFWRERAQLLLAQPTGMGTIEKYVESKTHSLTRCTSASYLKK